LFETWTRARDEAELQAGMEQLGQALVEARSGYQQSREYDEALFGQDFAAD
jgi:hypothetical protein